jgi:hypothetical protein
MTAQLALRLVQRDLRSKRAAEIARLVPLAQELAREKGAYGTTVGEIRWEAIKRGLLPLKGTGRELSWLVGVPRAAGLVKTDRRRLSPLAATRNLNTVWTYPGAR